MKVRNKLAKLALSGFLLLGCSAATAPALRAQEGPSDAAKRRVKSKVVPDYPAIARQLNLRGKVKIEATVSADGHVTNTNVVGGNPVLASSAVDAIKKWRFEPGPKDTTELIEIDFGARN